MAADEKIVIEFVGDPRGLKPAYDALRVMGSLTKAQVKELDRINAEYAKQAGAVANVTKEQKKLGTETEKTGKAVKDLGEGAKVIPKNLKDGADGFQKSSTAMIASLKNIAAAMGVAFGLAQIASYIKESVRLAAAGEGIRTAFARIGSADLLKGLDTAVRGTVSEIDLMRNAVKADNFKIPLEDLATLFEFARRRAKDTGESVDFLVDSIVLGIGRKSPMILDNLGISATLLRDRIGEVGVETANIGDVSRIVAQIAQEEMRKMGKEISTTNDLLAQGSAAWKNLSETSGEFFIKGATGIAFLLGLIKQVDPKLVGIQLAMNNMRVDFTKDIQTGVLTLSKLYEKIVFQLERVNTLEAQRKKITEEMSANVFTKDKQLLVNLREQGKALDLRILSEKERLKLLREVFETEHARQKTAGKEDPNLIKNIFYYENALKNVNEELKSEKVSLARINVLLIKQKEIQSALDALTGTQEKEEAINRSIRSLENLKFELSELTAVFEKAEVGTGGFLKAQDDVIAKTREIEKEMHRLQIRLIENAGLDLMIPKGIAIMGDTLDSLSLKLSLAREEMNKSPEFSSEYNKAAKEVEFLTKRIEEFGDSVINVNGRVASSSEDITQKVTGNWELSISQISSGMSSLFQSINKIQSDALAFEMSQLDDQLEKGLISRERYEQRRKSIARKQANDAKNARLFEAVINVATAVTSALASYDYASAILFGIIGGIEVAAIAAQPIPQFAKGTKDAPAGFKWVGEDGPELTYDKGGYAVITNGESKILADSPFSPQARQIMKKYDIPQLHTGLFNQSMKLSSSAQSAAMGQSRGIDYDRLGDAIASKMMFQDRNLLQMIQKHIRTDKQGFEILAEALKTKTRGGYV